MAKSINTYLIPKMCYVWWEWWIFISEILNNNIENRFSVQNNKKIYMLSKSSFYFDLFIPPVDNSNLSQSCFNSKISLGWSIHIFLMFELKSENPPNFGSTVNQCLKTNILAFHFLTK